MDAATFATAYALSTSAGIRPFLTLAIASAAMHFGYLHPAHAFAFLGSDGATWVLAGLALLEFGSDKIPVVDHALHVVHFAIKPIAAALLVGGTLPATGFGDASNPFELASDAMIGAGAFNAIGVHAGVAAARGASSSLTFGAANPIVSLIEDGSALVATVLAIALPFIGATIAVGITLIAIVVARAIWIALRKRSPVFVAG